MTLDENDYLTFQLYTASKTPRIRKARMTSWIGYTLTFGGLAYIFIDNGNDNLGIYFLVLSLLALTLFPFYTRWYYKRHYLRYIRDTFKNKFAEKCEIEFNTDTIVTRDKSSEMKFYKSEIEVVNEIRDYYFIKMRSGTSLIVSKSKSRDIEEVRNVINSMIEELGLKHNIELDWKWR